VVRWRRPPIRLPARTPPGELTENVWRLPDLLAAKHIGSPTGPTLFAAICEVSDFWTNGSTTSSAKRLRGSTGSTTESYRSGDVETPVPTSGGQFPSAPRNLELQPDLSAPATIPRARRRKNDRKPRNVALRTRAALATPGDDFIYELVWGVLARRSSIAARIKGTCRRGGSGGAFRINRLGNLSNLRSS